MSACVPREKRVQWPPGPGRQDETRERCHSDALRTTLAHSSDVLALIYFVLKGIGIMKSSPMTLQKEDLICIFLQQEEEIHFPQAKKFSLISWVLL